MRLILLFLFGMMGLHINAVGQGQTTPSLKQLRQSIQSGKPDTSRISLELKLGSYYLNKDGALPKDLDSALRYFNQALDLSNKIHSDIWKYKTLTLIGNYEFENGQLEKGTSILNQVAAFYHQRNDLNNEAQTLRDLGDLLYNNDHDDPPRRMLYYEHSKILFTKVHNEHGELDDFLALAYMSMGYGSLDTAERYALMGIKRSNSTADKYNRDWLTYTLAQVYNFKGLYDRALFYELKFNPATFAKNDDNISLFYAQIAVTYSYLGFLDKALYYNAKALKILSKTPDVSPNYFPTLSNDIKYLLAEKRSATAFNDLIKGLKNVKLVGVDEKGYVFKNYGQCYAALGDNARAGKYYDKMMSNYEPEFKNWMWNDVFEMNMYINNVCTAVDFFINTGQYKKAGVYFDRIYRFIEKVNYISTKIKMLPLEVKLDSVAGNYKKAFYDLTLYKKINDSVYNSTKSQQIAQMQTEFETTQKEHAINLLQSQAKTQNLQLQTVNLERNVTLGSVVVLLILSALAYNRYLFKQKTNNELQAKQLEINSKNESLERLVSDKDKLIAEKEWLLREVHHRVKNNLHTVICLLESQAYYLQDDALKAIQASQHRIYAMSLIHQKLYQDKDKSTIEISSYLKEFIGYLKDSFGAEEKIAFKLNLQAVHMSVAQAVPIALIINEAVTNSIKYAFPDLRKGEINISLKEHLDVIELIISDNGIGINSAILNKELNSLGLALIEGLTTDLNGSLEIRNVQGTSIVIIFHFQRLLTVLIA